MLWPAIIAFIVGGLFMALWFAARARLTAVAGAVWLVYAVYELLMYARILCSGDCNIRIDLLLLWPLLLGVSLAVPIGYLVRRRKAPTGRQL